MAVPGISWSGVIARVAFAVALVLVTYNPAGWSFYHWLTAPPPGVTATKALAGVALAIGWVICLRTAFVALGVLGLVLGAALLASFVWVLADYKLVEATGPGLVWIALLCTGVVLGLGLSWSLVRARATGQIEVQ